MPIFRNREAEWLRDLIKRNEAIHIDVVATLKDAHEKECQRLEAEYTHKVLMANQSWADLQRLYERLLAEANVTLTELQYERLRERTELKKAHAEELNRVIEENQKLRDDVERMRLVQIPALQQVELPRERTTQPPAPNPDTETGTSWQRIQRREIAAQEKRWNEKHVKPATDKPEGESNGVSSEGRKDVPLGGESKTA